MVEIIPDKFNPLKKFKISAMSEVAVVDVDAVGVLFTFGSWFLFPQVRGGKKRKLRLIISLIVTNWSVCCVLYPISILINFVVFYHLYVVNISGTLFIIRHVFSVAVDALHIPSFYACFTFMLLGTSAYIRSTLPYCHC